MHKIAIVLLSLMLIVAPMPLYAQAIPVTPEPTAVPLSQSQIVEQILEYLQKTASSDASTVNTSVLIQAAMNLGMLALAGEFVWRGGLRPMYKTMEDDRKRADDAEARERRLHEDYQTDRQRQAELQDRQLETLGEMVKTMKTIRTRSEVVEDHKALAKQIGTDVETHDKETRRVVLERIELLETEMKKRLGSIDETLRSVLNDMRAAVAAPAEPPSAERGTVGEVDAAEKG